MSRSILTLAEHEQGQLKDVSFELLGMAQRLAEGGTVKTALLGQGLDGPAKELAERGANEVLYLDSEALAEYVSDGYRQALLPLIQEEKPELVLVGHTPNGWEIAPLLAAGLDIPLATGCSDVAFEEGQVRLVRKAFNGKFVHEVAVNSANAGMLMATVDKGASEPAQEATGGSVRKVEWSPKTPLRTRFVEIKKGESSGLDLTQASVIVSGGRGVGAPEKFEVIHELAEALGGQVGASRAVTDAGWLPHEHQIGSSGVTVSPKLYLACGISGAIQHVVGMKGSGYIVAINKDADAPIFGIADVGVVGDLFEIVPALSKAAKG